MTNNSTFHDSQAYDARCPDSAEVSMRSAFFFVSFTLTCCLSGVLVFGALLGNGLILVVLRRVSSIHPPSRALFGSLAASDLCVGLIVQPIFVVYSASTLRGNASICTGVQPYLDVIGFAFCSISLITTTAISVDRLLALTLKFRYREVVTLRRVRAVVLLTWLLSFAAGSLNLFSPAAFTNVQIAGGFFCVSGSTFSYARINYLLRRRRRQRQPGRQAWEEPSRSASLNSDQSIARYKKTVSTALWVYCILLACYLPYMVVAALWAVNGAIDAMVVAHSYAITLVYLNSSLNPALYCWKIREVRHAVKGIFSDISFTSSN